MSKKTKVLAWMDSPLSVTGFGVVAKNLLGRLHNMTGFEVGCIGINHFDEHPSKMFEGRNDVPYKVYIGQDLSNGANNTIQVHDRMARGRTSQILKDPNHSFDIFFYMRDLWDMVHMARPGAYETYFPFNIQLAKEHGKNFRVIGHFPMEYQLQQQWVPMLNAMDFGYCFTNGGMAQLEPWKDKIKWAPQGADTKVFRELIDGNWKIWAGPGYAQNQHVSNKNEFRRVRMFPHRQDLDVDNLFIVLNVNRNQPRKDIKATIEAFAKFKHGAMQVGGGKKPVLWLHMRPDDQFGDARHLVEQANLRVDEDVFFPPNFSVATGWAEDELNAIYNASDVFISTSVAEGFGLTPVEAGCAGLPTIVPGHTGFLQTVTNLDMPLARTLSPEMRKEVGPSPVFPTDTNHMAQLIMDHYRDPHVLEEKIAKNGKKFRKMFNWDTIFRQYWEPVFQRTSDEIKNRHLKMEKNKDRFLFVCEEAAGDIVGATKAIDTIKKSFPDREIDFMCKPQYQDLVVGNPDISRILDWDINKIFEYPADGSDIASDRNRLIYPHRKIRHGSWSRGFTHLLDMQAEMAGVIAGDAKITTKEHDMLIDDIDGTTYPYITVNTTSQGGKMISPQKWSHLIQNVLRNYPKVRFVLVGGPNDMDVPGVIDKRGLPWREMAYVQENALMHIGIDSGPGHIADAVGTPSIIFWGWTNVAVCRPQRYSINISAHYPTVCPALGPCHGVTPACGINQYDRQSAMNAPCLQSIQVEPAIEIISQALQQDDPKEWLKEYSSKFKDGPIYNIPSGAPQG